MKRRGWYFLVGILFAGWASPALADPPAHLDFIRALRAKNYSDLALEYLNQLAKDPPADLAPYLPLERARTQLEMAAVEFNAGKRDALLRDARAGFEKFIKDRPNDPAAAEAAFENARILILEGRAIVTRARVIHPTLPEADARKALEKFKKGSAELSLALEKIRIALEDKNPPPAVRTALESARLWATLEFNIARLDTAAALEATNENRDDAQKLKTDAIAALTDKDNALIGKDKTSPVYWLAHAWIYKANVELTQGPQAKAELDLVLGAKGEAADPAKRLVRYLRFMEDVNGARAKDANDHGTDWLREYRSFAKSAEGHAIQYHLGRIFFEIAQPNIPDPEKGGKIDAKTKENLEKAQAYLKPLADTETDFKDLASERLALITNALNGVWDGNLADVVTFDRAYELALAQASKLGHQKKVDREKTLEVVLKLLNRALSLADRDVTDAKLSEVRSNLSYVYLATDKSLQAVVAGEDVAYRSKSPKAAAGAGYAVQAYLQLIEQGMQNNVNPKWLDVDRARLAALFEHMKKTWPDEDATDSARHRIGDSLARQERYEEAADMLGKISNRYKPVVFRADARYQYARVLQKLSADPKTTEEKKKVYHSEILKALRDVDLDDSSAFGAQLYVQAKLMLGYSLYEAKEYKELDDVSNDLSKKLAKLTKLDAATKADLQKTVDALAMWAQFGRATGELNAGDVVSAGKKTDAAIAQVRKTLTELREVAAFKSYQAAQKKLAELSDKENPSDDEKKKIEEARTEVEKFKAEGEPLERHVNTYSALLRGLMIVSLRANVQAGNRAGAMKALQVLQETESGTAAGAGIYRQLVAQFNKQIKDLESDPKSKDQAAVLKKNFADFLDELGKDKSITIPLRFFLASSNSSLGRHVEAAALLAAVPEPARPQPGKPPADLKAEGEYRAARRMQVHELTLGGKFADAEAAVKKAEDTSDGWGKEDVEMLKVKAGIYQAWAATLDPADKKALEKWALATKSWADVVVRLQKRWIKSKLPKDKELYCEASYEWLYCFSKYTPLTPPDKRPDYVKRLAANLFKFETAQPDFGGGELTKKFKDLINTNGDVKKEYDDLKKSTPTAAAPAK